MTALSVVTNGSVLTVGVPSGQEYLFPSRFSDATITKIVKEGLGTLNLGIVTNTFGGVRPDFEIKAGILKGIHGYNNANGIGGSFGRAKSFSISSGAQLYFLDTMKGSAQSGVTTGYSATDGGGGTWVGGATVTVAGSGPDGTGAIRRPLAESKGGHNLFGVGTTITMTGPTSIAADSRWGIGSTTLDMNGYDLTLVGNYQFEIGRSSTKVTFKNPGRIVTSGARTLFENGTSLEYSSGTKPEVVIASGGVDVYGSELPLPVSVSPDITFAPSLRLGYGDPGSISGAVSYTPTGLQISSGQAKCYTNILSGGVCGDGPLSLPSGNIASETVMIEGAATNRFGMLQLDAGHLILKDTTTNVICTALKANGGGFEIADSVRTEVGSIVMNTPTKSGRRGAIVLDDAGYVLVTNRQGGTSYQKYVPLLSTTPIIVAGSSSVGKSLARMVVSGKTVLTGVEPNPDGLSGGFIALATADQYSRAILEISGGAIVSNDIYVTEGNVTQLGAIYLKGADSLLYCRGTSASMNWIGRNAGYATLEMQDGELIHGGYLTVGQSGRGFIVQRGGTIRLGSAPLKLARTEPAYAHYLNLGGTFTGGPGGLCDVRLGFADEYRITYGTFSALTVDGRNGTSPRVEVATVQSFMITNNTPTAVGIGVVNINRSGTLAAQRMFRTAWNFSIEKAAALADKASQFYVNFDGGTLETTLNGAHFFDSDDDESDAEIRLPSRVTVYSGGATVDTCGNSVRMDAPFLKPYGKGVASVTLTDAESLTADNSLGTRRVRITGSGFGADAVTDFNIDDRSNSTSAIVTSPGFGYTDATTASVEAYKIYTVVSNATVSLVDFDSASYAHGGFTKKGAGTLTLASSNTWGGVTRVEGGTLALTHADGFPGTTLELSAAAMTNAAAPLLVSARLAFASGAGLRVTGAEHLEASQCPHFTTVISTVTPLSSVPSVTFVGDDGEPEAVEPAWQFRLRNGGTQVQFGYQRGTCIIMR